MRQRKTDRRCWRKGERVERGYCAIARYGRLARKTESTPRKQIIDAGTKLTVATEIVLLIRLRLVVEWRAEPRLHRRRANAEKLVPIGNVAAHDVHANGALSCIFARRAVVAVFFERGKCAAARVGIHHAKRVKRRYIEIAELGGCAHTTQKVVFVGRRVALEAARAGTDVGGHGGCAHVHVLPDDQSLPEIGAIVAQHDGGKLPQLVHLHKTRIGVEQFLVVGSHPLLAHVFFHGQTCFQLVATA